ncbi:MAG: hypothetical protein FJX74_02375 [Armatimonadetes bacterium]|nr:hypothetical protein [Armatimonadota bacterium]
MARMTGEHVTRRRCLGLALGGAGGLWLMLASGCRAGRSLLDKWNRLGDVWRRFRSFEGGKVGVWRRPSFNRFKKQMQAALSDLPAWGELRGIFEQRAGCIESCLGEKEARLVGISCYARFIVGRMAAARDARKQVEQLLALVANGALTEAAARKAAAQIAREAQYIALADEAGLIPDKRRRRERERELEAQRHEDAIAPGPGAELAGDRLTELTVGKLGWLAGPPMQNEGFPAPGVDNPQD